MMTTSYADILELRKFVVPEFIFGAGSRNWLARYVSHYGGRRILLVTDPGVVAAGWAGEAADSLERAGVVPVMFTEVSPNPRDAEVMAGAGIYRHENCDLIVAVGGGSPMDCAKGIGVVAAGGGHIAQYEGVDKIGGPLPPLICVPTTSGSAADVSQFAIILHIAQAYKMALISKSLVPDVSLIDPETLLTLNPELTACVGMDALSHAVEAYVSNASSPITDLHSLTAIQLIGAHLVEVVRRPRDLTLRAHVMLASLMAGMAFSNASLGMVHAMSHSLGGYRDLAHGECNAILLPRVMEFNFEACPEKFAGIGRALGADMPAGDPGSWKSRLTDRMAALERDLGMTRGLGGLGISRADVPVLARKALADPCLATNPRDVGLADIESLYESLL